MTIRSKLICGFIFMAFLVGSLSYVVLHATGMRDSTFTSGVATILFLVVASAQAHTVLVSVLTFLTVLVVGVFISSFVSRPFSVLTQAAVEVGGGRFDESLEDTIR